MHRHTYGSIDHTYEFSAFATNSTTTRLVKCIFRRLQNMEIMSRGKIFTEANFNLGFVDLTTLSVS